MPPRKSFAKDADVLLKKLDNKESLTKRINKTKKARAKRRNPKNFLKTGEAETCDLCNTPLFTRNIRNHMRRMHNAETVEEAREIFRRANEAVRGLAEERKARRAQEADAWAEQHVAGLMGKKRADEKVGRGNPRTMEEYDAMTRAHYIEVWGSAEAADSFERDNRDTVESLRACFATRMGLVYVNDAEKRLHLAVMGFPTNATFTLEELKTRRRSLVLIHHPDKGGTHHVACEINEAYEQLLKYIIVN